MANRRKTNWPFSPSRPALYFICDPALLLSGSMLDVVKKAVAGGASVVQLRDKTSDARSFLIEAKKLAAFLRKINVPFIINDRVDIAMACGADGVHLGNDDLPIAQTRNLLGAKKIIGASAHTAAQAKKAEKEGADYIGAGQVFHTTTKGIKQHPISISKLTGIRKAVSIPVIAIGGIKLGNAARVMESGVAGIAVVSAIMSAKNPGNAATRLAKIIKDKN
ncbi:MAG: thiamine phosphate synthase [Nitrospinota bacterium]